MELTPHLEPSVTSKTFLFALNPLEPLPVRETSEISH